MIHESPTFVSGDSRVPYSGRMPPLTKIDGASPPRARTPRPTPVALVNVETTPAWDHDRFRQYVLKAATAAGFQFETTADLSRLIGINRSILSKWFRGTEQLGMENLRRLAAATKAPLTDLLILAGRSGTEEISRLEPPQAAELPHPLAREISHMLADDSPIPEDERALLERLIDRVVAPERRWMRRRRTG